MTHYEVLGVPPTAGPGEVRAAYLRLARQHHPDLAGGDQARMRAINLAWEVLGDPGRRARYDASLQAPASPGPARAAGPGTAPGGLDDLLADLDDDTPIGGTVVLPRWLSLVPVATFAVAVVAGVLGMLLTAPGLLAFGVMTFLLSCVLFVAAPFAALLASRRRAR